MKKTIALIQKAATGRRVAVLFLVTMSVYLTMLLHTIPSVIAAAPGMKLFDMSPGGYTTDYAFTLLEAIGPGGRNAYLSTQLPLDFVYPGLFAVTYSFLLIWLLGKSFEDSSRIFYFALVPVAAGIFDYLENIGIIVMIHTFPDLSAGVVKITSVLTILKSGFTVAFYILLVIGSFPLIKKRIHGLRKQSEIR
ncbi:hypothetical protein KKI24_01985 [bacterium]|nr:hypothetical protein [bacterium]